MPLSEHEQRILEEIERRLAEEDPKFARTTTKTTPRGLAVVRIKRAVFGFVLGLVLLLTGLVAGGGLFLPLGLVAFAVMLLAVVSLSRAAKDVGRTSGAGGKNGMFDRFDTMWKRRPGRGSGDG